MYYINASYYFKFIPHKSNDSEPGAFLLPIFILKKSAIVSLEVTVQSSVLGLLHTVTIETDLE